jgi:hypothetical protein
MSMLYPVQLLLRKGLSLFGKADNPEEEETNPS